MSYSVSNGQEARSNSGTVSQATNNQEQSINQQGTNSILYANCGACKLPGLMEHLSNVQDRLYGQRIAELEREIKKLRLTAKV